MAKITVLVLVLSGQVSALQQPFLAFIPGLDQVGSVIPIRFALQAAVLVAAAALMFNRFVRTACLVIGAVILLSILSSRMYYQNNRLYTGLILLMAGLFHPQFGGRLVQFQIVLMYVGAAFNKLLEVDWRTGQFFATWAATSPYHSLYSGVAHMLPANSVYLLMGWSVIVVEFAIVVGFIFPRSRPLAIWLAVGYHTSLLVVAGRTFGLFWFVLLASYLAFVDWPPVAGTVFAPVAGMWLRLSDLLRRLDLERGLTWLPGTTVSLELRTVDQVKRTGATAVLFIVLVNPITYLASAALLAPLPEHRVRLAGVVVLGVLGLIAIDFVGNRARPLWREIRQPGRSASWTGWPRIFRSPENS